MASDRWTLEELQTHLAHAQLQAPPTLESPVQEGTATRRRRTAQREEGSAPVERVSVGGRPRALPRPRERRPTSSRARRERA
eukprot:544720-Pyramimonas_sp.AAC.2